MKLDMDMASEGSWLGAIPAHLHPFYTQEIKTFDGTKWNFQKLLIDALEESK